MEWMSSSSSSPGRNELIGRATTIYRPSVISASVSLAHSSIFTYLEAHTHTQCLYLVVVLSVQVHLFPADESQGLTCELKCLFYDTLPKYTKIWSENECMCVCVQK